MVAECEDQNLIVDTCESSEDNSVVRNSVVQVQRKAFSEPVNDNTGNME